MNTRLPGIAIAGLCALGAATANAALVHQDPGTGYVTSITGLDIDGTLYNATFHSGVPLFDIWPTHALDPVPYASAATAIADALGTSEQTDAAGDSFHIPVSIDDNAGTTTFHTLTDLDSRLAVDVIGSASFDIPHTGGLDQAWYPADPLVSFSAVPLPAALPLLGSALLCLAGVTGRRHQAR